MTVLNFASFSNWRRFRGLNQVMSGVQKAESSL